MAVIKTQSFGQAAEIMSISQPSVSVHIKSLENKLDSKLFTRSPGQVPKVTESGQFLMTYANEILNQTQELQSVLLNGKKQLKIGAQRFVTQTLLGSTFETLSGALKEVEVIVRTGTFEEVRDLYLKREVDLAFFLTTKDDTPSWLTTQINQYRLALIAHPNHPLAKNKTASIGQLTSYPFIVAFKQSYFSKSIDLLLAKNGIQIKNVAAQAEDAGTVKEMVKAGMGLAFTLLHSVRSEIDRGELVEIDLDSAPMYFQLGYAKNLTPVNAEIEDLIEKMKISIEYKKYQNLY